MAWNWKKMNSAKKSLIRRGAVELAAFGLAMGVAKLTYKVANRVPADADVLLGGGAR